MDKIKTGNMIREARTRKGYTQSELGALIGVSNKAVSRWENGDSFPDIGVLEQLSNILELSIQDIVAGEHCGDTEDTVKELTRVAKIQTRDKIRKIRAAAIDVAVLLILLIYSYFVFAGKSGISSYWNCFIMMAGPFALLIYKVVKHKEISAPRKNRLSCLFTIISMASGVLMVGLSYYIGYSVVAVKTAFDLSITMVGLFFSAILLIVLMMNLVFLIGEGYRAANDKTALHYGFFSFGFYVQLGLSIRILMGNMTDAEYILGQITIITVASLAEVLLMMLMCYLGTRRRVNH